MMTVDVNAYLHVVVGREQPSQVKVGHTYPPYPPRHHGGGEHGVRKLKAGQEIGRPQPLLVLRG